VSGSTRLTFRFSPQIPELLGEGALLAMEGHPVTFDVGGRAVGGVIEEVRVSQAGAWVTVSFADPELAELVSSEVSAFSVRDEG
jgi:hypothetical protein